jgi:glucose dehydrogenase
MIHYTRLKEIRPSNISQLRVAWTYDTHDSFDGSEMQCNPIVEHGVLFATTPKVRVIALDAATGKLLWSFNPQSSTAAASRARNRGLSYWTDGKQERLFFAFRDRLFALDAKTGKPATEFGKAGIVDLKSGLGRNSESINISLTTPGIVYKTASLSEASPAKIYLQSLETSGPITRGLVRSNGRFIPFRIPVNRVMQRGPRTRGSTAEPRMTGPGCRSMINEA